MKNLSKLSIGAVAAGAIAAPSAATTTTVNLNFANNGSGVQYITLGGNATPQYQYQTTALPNKYVATFNAPGTSGFGAQALSYTSNPDLPALGVATFQPVYTVGNSNANSGNRYLPLQFDINGTTTVGNAFFNNANDLVKIDYAAVSGVPEPAIWAEFVAGFGLAGAAMRRRRPQAAALTA